MWVDEPKRDPVMITDSPPLALPNGGSTWVTCGVMSSDTLSRCKNDEIDAGLLLRGMADQIIDTLVNHGPG